MTRHVNSVNMVCFLPLLLLMSSSNSAVLSQLEEFTYNGFSTNYSTRSNSSGGGIRLNGFAEIEDGGILRLTNETQRLIGRSFYPSPLRFLNATDGSAYSFSTAFAFGIVPEYPNTGGHGLAFVLTPNMELPGGLPSQYLGILNASDAGNFSNHVFFVEFDTVQDFEFGDINDNHVGININDMRSNSSAAAAYRDESGADHKVNLKGGEAIQAWVDYDGARKVVNVTVAPSSTKPSTPLISFPLDLSAILKDTMFVGFSCSTGLLASSHYLLGWSFKMNGAAPSLGLSALPSLPQSEAKNVGLIVGISVSSFLLVLVAVAVVGYALYKYKTRDVIELWELQYGPHRFSYDELKKATNGFRDKELLGFGGFGKVYKGVLPSTKDAVAVKRVSHESRQGLREFVTEIASIGRLRHRNLVQLQGWCRRRGDLLLVYDYMPNGSLDKLLFDHHQQSPSAAALTWAQRYRILRGVASALLYLHEEWEHVVIHRDVKASNVLLDADMCGRLGDFGLAKLHDHGANPSTTRVVGTLGYLAPELTRTGKPTTGSDVFAFGALVLETVCGRRPIEAKAEPEELVLVDWVWEMWSTGRGVEVVDQRLRGNFKWEEVVLAIKVGLMCSQPAAAARPTMREVVRYLDGDAELPGVTTPRPDSDGDGADGKEGFGFDKYVHSYPSTSFEESKSYSSMFVVTGGEYGGRALKGGSGN